jgi:hypothetical protein
MQTYREEDWKLLLDRLRDRKELYNLRDDPGEQHDLFEEKPDIVRRLYNRLIEHYNRNLQVFHRRRKSGAEQEQEKLRELASLGYVNIPARREIDTEYFPMKPIKLMKFGPFGDEDDLSDFSDQINLTGSHPVTWGQVIQGCFPGGGMDTSGTWFDQQAIFLLPNRKTMHRISFDITLDPQRGTENPTEIDLLFNEKPVKTLHLNAPGSYRIEGDVPYTLIKEDYFYAGLRANRAFVIASGGSPGKEVYGSIKIKNVRLL